VVPGHAGKDPKVLVDHCLVGDQGNNDERCGIHYSTHILIIVCFCTISEGMLIFWVWRHQSAKATMDEKITMVTIGDAIANFLKKPDPVTVNTSDSSMENTARLGGIETRAETWPANSHSSWVTAIRGDVWGISLVL
jgi:hypothetical protein